MIILPPENRWVQTNNSDKLGSLWYTKNINLDEAGYLKLSPRAVTLTSEAINADFGIPVGIGRFSNGAFLVGTTSNANFNVATTAISITADENDGTNEPTMTSASHTIFWRNLWHASTATAVLSRATSSDESATWTSRITGLTSGVRHYMAIFESQSGSTLCVTNGNVIKQYDTSYSGTTDLTISTDYEAVGLAYNTGRLGVITRLGTSSEGQSKEARFFVWDGSTTAANSDAAMGANSAIAVCAYNSSFAILTQTGQLLYWNGGGFDELAAFPFYFDDKVWGDILNQNGIGDMMIAEGDNIYINLGFELDVYSRKAERMMPNNPSGVWCFDPKVGLYHRWSPSISTVSVLTVSAVDTGTDIITVSSGTIPATGNPIRYSSASTAIGGLTVNYDYYVIKLSASTFQLAETKEQALSGVAINLTSSGTSSYFWAFDLVDYGATHFGDAGALAFVGETNGVYRDIIFGGDYPTTALAANDSLCIVTPFLEARGYFITPKMFSGAITDAAQRAHIKFRPLAEGDSIVVKGRNREYIGLPVTSSGKPATWTGAREFYTTQDLSDVKTHLDAGVDIEIEFVAGAGGGVCVQIASITEEDGTYSVVLEEDVLGASSGRQSEYVITNWKPYTTITNANKDGYAPVKIGATGTFHQLKVELRGSSVTIEGIQFINSTHKQAA